jgi:hypothetical protein
MADDAARARVGEPVGARKRRLPASVRDAARPKAKTTPREKSARGASAREKARTTARGRAANQVTENARAESPVREEARLYDVVSDDDEDDDAAARAAAVPTASTSTATTLTSTAIGCVKTVTDDALVEAARFYCGSSTKAKALASAAEPSPPPEPPPPAPPPAKPAPSRQPLPWSNKLETFDDMFSMFTGGTAAPSGVSQPSTAANANASRGAAAETFVEALRSQPDPATVTAKTKPKLSFAALMANDEPESFEDSD